jgi:hypothetical protein
MRARSSMECRCEGEHWQQVVLDCGAAGNRQEEKGEEMRPTIGRRRRERK